MQPAGQEKQVHQTWCIWYICISWAAGDLPSTKNVPNIAYINKCQSQKNLRFFSLAQWKKFKTYSQIFGRHAWIEEPLTEAEKLEKKIKENENEQVIQDACPNKSSLNDYWTEVVRSKNIVCFVFAYSMVVLFKNKLLIFLTKSSLFDIKSVITFTI